jgi:hypothetical protein
LRQQRGAVELTSIMVGVIILGIIGGIIAAVFTVIPWTLVRAAQASLSNP